MITPIEKLSAIPSPEQSRGGEAVAGAGGFADIFRSAVDNVKQTNAELVEAEYLLSVGELDNPAALTIASSKYSLSVELLVQLRNRALDAYNELTRISL
jgi:flagellar hook-basal body complex protein FliE